MALEPLRYKIRVFGSGVVFAEAWEVDLETLEAFVQLRDRLRSRVAGVAVERALFDRPPDRPTPVWRPIESGDTPK